MANRSVQWLSRVPRRLRDFVERLAFVAIAWLAFTGLIETVRSGDYPSPWILAAMVIGSALGAAVRPVAFHHAKPITE